MKDMAAFRVAKQIVNPTQTPYQWGRLIPKLLHVFVEDLMWLEETSEVEGFGLLLKEFAPWLEAFHSVIGGSCSVIGGFLLKV
ncbi:hypothetical protein TIFTF001_031101 [Ficus carica]|uniref:Uncharacterized protein n=1 Tax=Ficus carica TaxID=3494 RepID=A0AA88J5W5_FICCA|nr:hypothetical protein TIFTF001_031101 [Ficus carica]